MAEATTEKLKPLDDWKDGLSSAQTEAVAECIKTVATTTAGTYKQLAAAFAKVKATLPEDGRNWIKWTNSVVLNVGARTIQELAGASAWLESTTVPDEILGKLAARTISMIANAPIDKQKELESQLYKKILTVTDVKIALEGERKVSDKATPKQLIANLQVELSALQMEYDAARKYFTKEVQEANQIREERDTALAKVAELEKTVNAFTTALNSDNSGAAVAPYTLDTLKAANEASSKVWDVKTTPNSRTKSKATAV